MDEGRCELSDLPADQCACRIHGPQEKKPEDTDAFPARYPGRCGDCEGHFRKGDLIRRVDGKYAHAECL
jgi:hypothetical protein